MGSYLDSFPTGRRIVGIEFAVTTNTAEGTRQINQSPLIPGRFAVWGA